MANKRPKEGEKYYYLKPGGKVGAITYSIEEKIWEGDAIDIWIHDNEEIYCCREEVEEAKWERDNLQRLGSYYPSKGDTYFYVKCEPGSCIMKIAKTIWLGSRDDHRRKKMGMCFETMEDAMFYNRMFIRMVWKNGNQE